MIAHYRVRSCDVHGVDNRMLLGPELYVAIYDYAALNPDELSFSEGTIIKVEEKSRDG